MSNNEQFNFRELTMTYKERQKALCQQCSYNGHCAWQDRGLENKCIYLNDVMNGWELGQQDTLEAVENYIDRGNSVWTEEFMTGLKEYLKVE